MTTGSVSKISPISELTNVVNAQNRAAKTGNFSDVLKNSSQRTDASDASTPDNKKTEAKKDVKDSKDANDTVKTDKDANDAVKTDKDVNTDKAVKNDTGKENVIDEKDVIKDSEIDEEILMQASQMVQITAQVLNVEPEVVKNALDTLGLDETALLDSANIPQIVVEATDAQDSLAIMTDEQLFNDVKEISASADELVNSLTSKFDISSEEVKEVIKEVVNNTVTEPTAEEKKADVIQSLTNEVTGAQDAKETPEIKIDRKEASFAEGNDANAQMNWTQLVVDNIKAAAAESAGENEPVYSADMERIYEQVSESLKLNMSEDMTEMEMSLHPASLGNVRIQIASRDGVVTANFTTQNEQVKAVLEAQIVELKESMNEQGIKVEAIEVNVAAHAFEENLSKEGDNSSDYEAKGSRKRRSINLNEIDDTDDIDIDEDDEIRIAREMMMQSGATVDYRT